MFNFLILIIFLNNYQMKLIFNNKKKTHMVSYYQNIKTHFPILILN